MSCPTLSVRNSVSVSPGISWSKHCRPTTSDLLSFIRTFFLRLPVPAQQPYVIYTWYQAFRPMYCTILHFSLSLTHTQPTKHRRDSAARRSYWGMHLQLGLWEHWEHRILVADLPANTMSGRFGSFLQLASSAIWQQLQLSFASRKKIDTTCN